MRYLLLIAFLLLNACTSEQPLRLGTNVWPGYEPLYVARERGLLDPAEVRLVELSSASQVIRALQNGELDAAALTLDEAARVAAQGTDIAVALVLDISHGADAVVSHTPVNGATDLRGKRIILEAGSVGELMLEALLREFRLPPKDIRRVYRTVNDHARAFLAGEGDVLITFEPHVSRLLRRGDVYKIFDSRQIPDSIIDVLVIRQDRLAAHREKLEHVTQAWFDTLAFYQTDPEHALKLANRRLRANPEDLKAMYAGLLLGTRNVQQRLAARWPLTLKTAGELARLKEGVPL
ncbi:MAG: hypothetical protein D6758_07000 [Gammaproteobacteria bacterium]|nr:MAG: hypothetical protein D6758_07000 [Gammaproteobacteria bacterium]